MLLLPNDAPYHIRFWAATVLAVVLAAGLKYGLKKLYQRIQSVRSMTAFTLSVSLCLLLLWSVSMTCLTIVTAQGLYDRLYTESRSLPDRVEKMGQLGEFYDPTVSRYGLQYERPDSLEHSMLDALSYSAQRYAVSGIENYAENDSPRLLSSVSCPVETAVMFYDGEGNPLFGSDDDILFFGYFTEDEWAAGKDSSSGLHYGWIDMSPDGDSTPPPDDPWSVLRTMYAQSHSLLDIQSMRVTGVFEKNRLIPVSAQYVTEAEIDSALFQSEQFFNGSGYTYIVSDVDRTGLLQWQPMFDLGSTVPDGELVTVYLDRPEMWDCEESAVNFDESYPSLAALLRELDLPEKTDTGQYGLYSDELRQIGKFGLGELLVFGGRVYADYLGYDYGTGNGPEPEFIMVTAARSSPLACAVNALWGIYAATGVLAVILALILRGCVKKRLVDPLEAVAAAMEDGWTDIERPQPPASVWKEAYRLCEGYLAQRDWRYMKLNETARLNTALEFAKTAEQNRRRMLSNIAHELKTPLAVIHSYAQGLKEHIAEDKRERYVDIIIAEAERTDAMVVELLDLSRLEAGRVKLSRDNFSLAALVRSEFERLELDAKKRKLTVDLSKLGEFDITADEGRMTQVIGNLVSNAVKYTAEGGQIRVSASQYHGRVKFVIENDCEPLSDETLSHVWDPFYRADNSRSTRGTGLGLAIVKGVVELHGGSCYAESTAQGVKFGFEL